MDFYAFQYNYRNLEKQLIINEIYFNPKNILNW